MVLLERVSKAAGDIVTTEEYENFELSLEYRISKGGNSGIMFHVTEDQPQPWQSGPEVQIQDNVDGHDPQKSGWLYQLYKPVKPAWATQFENQVGFKGSDMDDATRPAGEWNHVYLRISPRQCEVAVNGVSYFYFHKGDEEWNQASCGQQVRRLSSVRQGKERAHLSAGPRRSGGLSEYQNSRAVGGWRSRRSGGWPVAAERCRRVS